MAYATLSDVKNRTTRTFSAKEDTVITNYLDDVAVLIDAFNANASADAKKIVSCNAVIRAMGNGDTDIPIGATQGSMSALGYSQSWTVGSGGSTSELYLSKIDKRLLGYGNSIGSYSPVQELVPTTEDE